MKWNPQWHTIFMVAPYKNLQYILLWNISFLVPLICQLRTKLEMNNNKTLTLPTLAKAPRAFCFLMDLWSPVTWSRFWHQIFGDKTSSLNTFWYKHFHMQLYGDHHVILHKFTISSDNGITIWILNLSSESTNANE